MNLRRGVSPTLYSVWGAIILHSLWLGSIFSDSRATRATAFSGLSRVFSHSDAVTTSFLSAVVLLALFGVFNRGRGLQRVVWLVPQQLALGISSFAALHAIWVSHFADGVERSRSFLISDQTPIVIMFVAHSLTILYLATHDR